MKPGGYDVVCPQGATLSLNFQWKVATVPVNLTGYTAAMQVRSSYNATTALISLTNGNGLTLDANGNIGVTVTATQTGAVPAGTYVWDLELTSGSTVTRLIGGRWMHTAQVTK